jgi:catechol 2,3-dioxygenase-like lactoylglutathione lyase family enzyme
MAGVDWKIEVLPLPVSDVDRAKHFYSAQCGFAVDHDTAVSPQMRIVQLTPPGSACSIVIGTGMLNTDPGSVQGVQMVVPDIDAAHAALASGGVETSPVQHFEGGDRVDGKGGPWNSFVFFADPDGNSWTIQERPAADPDPSA